MSLWLSDIKPAAIMTVINSNNIVTSSFLREVMPILFIDTLAMSYNTTLRS